MTDLRKAAEMALEVFGGSDWGEEPFDSSWTDKANATVEALRQALAQPEQKPVAWITDGGKGELGWRKTTEKDISLYTAPPKREWVGLTDEEAREIRLRVGSASDVYARAIEAALKEKNNA